MEMSSGMRHANDWAGMFVVTAWFKLFGVGNRVEDKVGGGLDLARAEAGNERQIVCPQEEHNASA